MAKGYKFIGGKQGDKIHSNPFGDYGCALYIKGITTFFKSEIRYNKYLKDHPVFKKYSKEISKEIVLVAAERLSDKEYQYTPLKNYRRSYSKVLRYVDKNGVRTPVFQQEAFIDAIGRHRKRKKWKNYWYPPEVLNKKHLYESLSVIEYPAGSFKGYALRWSVINPLNGYDYAEIQWEGTYKDKNGVERDFNRDRTIHKRAQSYWLYPLLEPKSFERRMYIGTLKTRMKKIAGIAMYKQIKGK